MHSLIKKATSLIPKNSPKGLKDFLIAFYSKVPIDDLETLEPMLMVETAQEHWRMTNARKAGQHKINIHSKVEDTDEGDKLGTTIINLINDDMAFLVDSVAATIGRYGKAIDILLHPILYAETKGKKLVSITDKKSDKLRPQSHMHIHLHGTLTAPQKKSLEEDLMEMFRDVHFATKDWLKMREKIRFCQKSIRNAPARYSETEIEEYIHFLEYLYKDNFTFLGYREYRFKEGKNGLKSETIKRSSMGLLHNDIDPVYISEDKDGLPEELQILRRDLPPVNIAKVNRKSNVHRPVPLDAIAIKLFDDKGKVIGESLFIGLFTSVTYSRSIEDIPLLRYKAEQVITQAEAERGSHDFKALRHILEKYPRDELFQIDSDSLFKTASSILRLQERQRVALYIRKDPFKRFISCLVYVPREKYDTRLRENMEKILEASLKGVCDDFQANLDDSNLARVLFIIKTDPNKPPRYNHEQIEKELQRVARSWPERLTEALLETGMDEHVITDIVYQYGEAFPVSYIEEYEPKQAVYDIEKIEELYDSSSLTLDLYLCKKCVGGEIRLKVFNKDEPVILSSILPILQNLGLRVISELPFEIQPKGLNKKPKNTVWVQDFLMKTGESYNGNYIEDVKETFQEALKAIWHEKMENDGLNRLILSAKMNWREVNILRTYVRYLMQTQYRYSARFVEKVLYNNPIISGTLIKLFETRFDPMFDKDREKSFNSLMSGLERKFEDVKTLDEDNVLRSITGLIKASLRTNFYQRTSDGDHKSYISIKLDSGRIPELPAPKPYREIYVYSPRVEGIHLRGDVIARGGIRWSDRHQDYRTEVLGLMKAQQVKNSVIIPMGAKGGFIVKNPPKDRSRAVQLAEGIACYELFIQGLLDITDNRAGSDVIAPDAVIRHDAEDPYLVVAADKGTASFSDIANSLSESYDFWLGDAFASGGSAGYDHKKMGITARGAWESVKRHFRELNHNTQTQDFDVIGVGDMGGDVFGNGMLLSEHIRLIGAYNHLHIFCDPDPDIKTSYKERERLFDNVLGWNEYNDKKLSPGGRIYSRQDKSLELTPEIMKRFDLDKKKVTPNELILAMLRARTDLLWFGGIGTYIKATHESNIDVGDKTNDYIRINATDVRAKVVGEGANLALTHSARIEYAQKGGRINADFIDNSGGVNSSDLEVNIKILFGDIIKSKSKSLSINKRNKLLEQMTDEVANLVLENNYQQTLGISLVESEAGNNLGMHNSLISYLEKTVGLDRKIENLPDDSEMEERALNQKGLTRPEISVVQAYAKIGLTKKLITSKFIDSKEIKEQWLPVYFPEPLQKQYGEFIQKHRLAREIIATTLANDMINRIGPGSINEIRNKTGASSSNIAKAYLTVCEIFGLRKIWANLEAQDNKVAAVVQLKAMSEINKMIERQIVWFLNKNTMGSKILKDTHLFKDGVQTLKGKIDHVITGDLSNAVKQRQSSFLHDGLPQDIARDIALIRPLGAGADIIYVANKQKADLLLAAKIYYELGSRLKLHWLRKQARFMRNGEGWGTQAKEGMIEQLYDCQSQLTARVLKDMKSHISSLKTPINDVNKIIDRWMDKNEDVTDPTLEFLKSLTLTGQLDLAALIVAEQRLRFLT